MLKVAHLSDTHFGYRAFSRLAPNGQNQRATDVVEAAMEAVNQIEDWGPDLVVHAGDVFDVPVGLPNVFIQMGQLMMEKLAAAAPTVVVAGNHDRPRSRKDISYLDLFRRFKGLTVVTTRPEPVEPIPGVVVWGLPHDSLRTFDRDAVSPVDGAVNILLTHGTAEISDMYFQARGREYPIPAETLLKPWDYAALGHWHRQNRVEVGNRDRVVWYAGSPENISFRDMRGLRFGPERGWLATELDDTTGADPKVTRRTVSNRTMIQLGPVTVDESTSVSEVETLVREEVDSVSSRVYGAVVRCVVEGGTRELWNLCDFTDTKRFMSDALSFSLQHRPATVTRKKAVQDEESASPDQFFDHLMKLAESNISEQHREKVLSFATDCLDKVTGSC